MVKRVLLILFVVLIALCVWQWQLVLYGVDQAKGQMKVIMEAKPVEDFLTDPNFPDSLKQKLKLVQQVSVFAMNELGLSHSDNYTTLYDQHGKTILWNVSACEPYELKAYKWYFPLLGSMPYKGFFDLAKAKKEASKLRSEGYDVRIRTVSGWSTLGILNDPILSNMLERSEGALAEVIIHELTHATIFVKDEIDFNENLASFIGERGAEIFLKKKYGDTSQQLQSYQQNLLDQRKLTRHILSGGQYLDSVYTAMNNHSANLKDSVKHLAMKKIASQMDTVCFFNTKYRKIFDEKLPNNAYFMAFKRYHSQEDTLTSIYATYNEDLIQLIMAMKTEYEK